MAVQRKAMTAEEFAQLPRNDMFEELFKGEVRTSPPPGGPHGRTAAKIHIVLGPFVEAHELGATFIETGFRVERSPDTVLAPDVCFVSAGRLPDPLLPGYTDLVPDLVVEVISPSESARSVDERMREWLRLGARLGWAADPRRRSVGIYQAGREPRVLQADETLDGGDVLPGFQCPVRAFFP